MADEKLEFCLVFMKILFILCLLAVSVNGYAVSTEITSGQPVGELPENSESEIEKGGLQPEGYIEAFEEDAEEPVTYNIYKKLNPDNPCDRGLDAYEYEKTWYDVSQIYINTRFCEPALWFDNFFANDRIFNEGVAGTYVRWRNEFSYDEEEYFDYTMKLNFSVELPGFNHKARLTFEGEEDEDLRDIAPGSTSDTTESLGLQFDVKEHKRSKFNVNVSLDPKLRLRYRYTQPVGDRITMRLTQELQRKGSVNSARSLFQYEHVFKESFLLRSSTEIKLSEEYEGLDWLQAFVLYQRLDNRTSLSYETSANGITQPRRLTTNYRLGIRFRKNIHREWLFYEIAPEYTWPITLDEDRSAMEIERRSKWRLFMRFEVHFGNAQKKRYQDYRN